jgi:hypothetical protein
MPSLIADCVWSTYLDVLICHADVLRVGLEILGRGHDGELNRPLIAKSLVRPFSHRADFLDCGNTVIRDEDLRGKTRVSARELSTRPIYVVGGFLLHL